MSPSSKRKYEEKLSSRVILHKDFLITHLQEEWGRIQRTARRQELLNQVKMGATTVAKILLALTAIGGVITIAAIAPNVLGAAGRLAGHQGFFEKKSFNKAKNYLKRQKYIRFIATDKETVRIEITDKGLKQILCNSFKNFKLDKLKKWDGLWRIVIFDVPNKHKWAREGFREKLKMIGFYQLQESVFIAPHQCEKEIDFLVSIFNIKPYVQLIKAGYLSDDFRVRKYFHL